MPTRRVRGTGRSVIGWLRSVGRSGPRPRRRRAPGAAAVGIARCSPEQRLGGPAGRGVGLGEPLDDLGQYGGQGARWRDAVDQPGGTGPVHVVARARQRPGPDLARVHRPSIT